MPIIPAMSSAPPPSVAAEKKALQAKLQDQERELGELRREAKAAAAQIKTATQQGELHRQELEKARRAAEALAADKQQLTLAQRSADREVQAMRLELKHALMVQQHMLQQQLNATAAAAEGASASASHTPPHSVASASSSSSVALGTESTQAGDARPVRFLWPFLGMFCRP